MIDGGRAAAKWVDNTARVVAFDLFRVLMELEKMAGEDFMLVDGTRDITREAFGRSLRALRSLHPFVAVRTYFGDRRKQKTLAVLLAKIVGAYDVSDLFPHAVVRSAILARPPTATEELALLRMHHFFARPRA
jgi:hypothetical protein